VFLLLAKYEFMGLKWFNQLRRTLFTVAFVIPKIFTMLYGLGQALFGSDSDCFGL